ncbi:MAG: arsenite methyltransferase [Candidatus Methanomethylophilaceae archaeon]|nr:methyltransferase domain-containing protein [Gammaproteobacteria bacterium]
MKDKEEIRESIRKDYSDVAKGVSKGCCGGGLGCCSTIEIKNASLTMGYSKEDLKEIPLGANMGLGCGNPIAIALLKEGERILDLGSGGGFDSFLARRKVGETGFVIGIDMTPEMIKLARNNAKKSGFDNVEFRLGEIENLPVADCSMDVVISNCVINLSLDKQRVFKEAYRVLKSGGRLSVSDVVATADIPEEIKGDLASISNCIAGAEHVDRLKVMLENAGFIKIRMMPKDNSREIIKSWESGNNPEDFVASFIIEAEKPQQRSQESER